MAPSNYALNEAISGNLFYEIHTHTLYSMPILENVSVPRPSFSALA
jgi:hypothetical protein